MNKKGIKWLVIFAALWLVWGITRRGRKIREEE